MINVKLHHLIAGVAVAAFFAVTFGTLGVLVVQEVKSCRAWAQVRDSVLRREES